MTQWNHGIYSLSLSSRLQQNFNASWSGPQLDLEKPILMYCKALEQCSILASSTCATVKTPSVGHGPVWKRHLFSGLTIAPHIPNQEFINVIQTPQTKSKWRGCFTSKMRNHTRWKAILCFKVIYVRRHISGTQIHYLLCGAPIWLRLLK